MTRFTPQTKYRERPRGKTSERRTPLVGRPPKATKESGAVSFDADAGCFVGANGMYWHGTANGGWSRQPPSGDKETGEKSSAKRANVDEPEAAAKKKPRGRPPACGHVEHRRSVSARSCSRLP